MERCRKKEFKEIKNIANHNNLLAYLDFNKRIEIHTDDSYIQLGADISK